jgi:two-component system alkaline phosphatase synthesis response regulator PhoP
MLNKKKIILIVDDEQDILEFVSYNLKREGYIVNMANNGKTAIELARKLQPDMILLDLMMPEMDGIEVCQHIRSVPEIKHTLIAMLTARAEVYSQIAGFEAGADDYILKPIKPKLLLSRINAILKRANSSHTSEPETNKNLRDFGNLFIDLEKHQVMVDQKEVNLPKKEFLLLTLLSSKPFRVFSREEIYNHIWGQEVFVSDRTIDVYIRKIREKVGQDRVKTVKSVGYRFEP